MENVVANVVDAILTAILQWKVAWLDEQKKCSSPPPICRTQPRQLKITYDNYKDYESTFVPLLMHEIWAQIFEEWTKLENEANDATPMEIDQPIPAAVKGNLLVKKRAQTSRFNTCASRQFWMGVLDYKCEGPYQVIIKCQYLVETSKLHSHLKLIGEGDLVRIDLSTIDEPAQSATTNAQQSDYTVDPIKKTRYLSLFGYVNDLVSERVGPYTTLAECYATRPARNFYAVNYNVVIAKRRLKLKLSEPMKMSGLYYLKPMIRQIESVANLRESALASDILCPKIITCQLSVPTIVTIKSPHYNDMQYKAIIGANEAMVRNIPKIQLIQGPPGTGKTHTLVGIIKHFYMHWKDVARIPKILICAPSNGAIDEVGKRLIREREFLKKGPPRRSLRLVRVGNPDQISPHIKSISLDELVEVNASSKIDATKKKHLKRIQDIELELSNCDTEISNLRYSSREREIPELECKIARLLKELEACKASEEITTKREVSEASKKNIKFELIKNADVILTTLSSCQRHPLDALFKNDRSELTFHCVIVDEASQCCEPELLMPLCYKIFKMILIGDPMQLPATVISRYAQEFNFGRSLFERFFIHFDRYNPTSPVAMLTTQYRMHPDICLFPSKQFYDNRLINATKPNPLYPFKPYILFDLMHSVEKKSSKSSFENQAEADLVRNLLTAVLTDAPEGSKVGVITPYKGQMRLITNKIESLRAQKNIEVDVNTCDGFQGQEKDIIILSCVRAFESNSGGSIGFLKSFQRINVALTRAKYCLIICISKKSLSKDKIWDALIQDAIERRMLQTLTRTPSSKDLVGMLANDEPSRLNDLAASKLVRTNGLKTEVEYEPEFVMPMDID